MSIPLLRFGELPKAWAVRAAVSVAAVAAIAANIAGRRPLWPRLVTGASNAAALATGRADAYSGTAFEEKFRAIAKKVPPDLSFAFVVGDWEHLSGVERTIHQSLAFYRLPAKTHFASLFNAVAYDAVFVPYGYGRDGIGDLALYGFRKTGETGSYELWRRLTGSGCASAIGHGPCSIAGLAALLGLFAIAALRAGLPGALASALTASCSAFVLFGLLRVPGRISCYAALGCGAAAAFIAPAAGGWRSCLRLRRKAPDAIAMFALYAAVTLILTLGHTFTIPNGLGVNGGRAALWHLSGSFQAVFDGGNAFDTFQPAYPPGLALLTFVANGISGSANDWQVQLLGLLPFWMVFAMMLKRAGNLAERLLALALFLNPEAIEMATNFYSEGWMLLFIVAGIETLACGRVRMAWFLIAAAGWFKAEGSVFALALFLAVRCARGRVAAPFCQFALSSMPVIAWWVFARLHGSWVFEYAPPWEPDAGAIPQICARFAKEAFGRAWETAFAFPVLALCGMAAAGMRRLAWSFHAAGLFAAFSFAALAWVFAISRADLEWHLASAAPRLTWCIALLASYLALTREKELLMTN